MIGLQNPKEEAIESRRKYDFGDEVLAWRIKLRKERQVSVLFQVHLFDLLILHCMIYPPNLDVTTFANMIHRNRYCFV